MGARGPLKLPTHLRAVTDGALAGTAAETTPKVAPVKPEIVAENADLSAMWDEIVPKLDDAGFVAATDGPNLALMCMAYLTAFAAFREIGGSVVVNDAHHGEGKKNPAEAVFRAEADLALRLGSKFGMDWAARARTPAAKGREDGEPNPFASASGG